MKNPFLFDLAKSNPLVDKKKSGTVRGAYEKNFPVVKNRAGAMFLVILDKGGIREPHWHPNAWEFDYCINGAAGCARCHTPPLFTDVRNGPDPKTPLLHSPFEVGTD